MAVQRRTVLLLVLGLLSLILLVQSRLTAARAPAEPDPLLRLNQAFRKAYAANRKAALDRTDPILIASGDDLVWLHKGKRTEVKFMPSYYHDLKTIAHAPLAVYSLLNNLAGSLPDEERKELLHYRDLVQVARDCLEKRWTEPKTLARQQQMLDLTLSFLDGVLKSGKSEPDALTTYCRKLAPLTLANAADAARSQIDALHAQVGRWRKEVTPEEWSRLRVIVIGSQMPRRGNVFVQYFALLLGLKGEAGPRLIYAESLWEEPAALRLLGTYLVDEPTGKTFYDDDQRLLRDLLSDGAADYLQTLSIGP